MLDTWYLPWDNVIGSLLLTLLPLTQISSQAVECTHVDGYSHNLSTSLFICTASMVGLVSKWLTMVIMPTSVYMQCPPEACVGRANSCIVWKSWYQNGANANWHVQQLVKQSMCVLLIYNTIASSFFTTWVICSAVKQSTIIIIVTINYQFIFTTWAAGPQDLLPSIKYTVTVGWFLFNTLYVFIYAVSSFQKSVWTTVCLSLWHV